ncbi:MAG: HPF/RaiA family ribosome-associated protein [Bryobacteraceae bacterium]|nr:HPF/RaiA family ribosome-associated protein [Bryobacteraceae bacterium]
MHVIEITFRDVPRDEAVERLIRQKAEKLERVCPYLTSCRVTVERESNRRRAGNAYRVRIDLTLPPGKELAVSRDPGDRQQQGDLHVVVRRAFEAARRQLKDLVEKQRLDVKSHPEQNIEGVVTKLFRETGYGFLRDAMGREVYFHRNSVREGDFDRLEVGTGVNFFENEGEGERGPQASTVRIVDKPGIRAPKVEQPAVEPPLGWR